MEQDNEKSIQSLVMEISRMYMEKCFVKLKKVGIHPRQIPILAVLYRRDGCSQKELAQELGVKPLRLQSVFNAWRKMVSLSANRMRWIRE